MQGEVRYARRIVSCSALSFVGILVRPSTPRSAP